MTGHRLAALALAVSAASPVLASGDPPPAAALAVAPAVALAPAQAAPAAEDGASALSVATELMEQARRYAGEVRRTAARLETMSGSKRPGTESHGWALADLRHDVNELGALLASLEQIRPQASELQKKAIADARPRVEAMVQATTRAIELRNERSENRFLPPYREAVTSIYENAAQLDRMLDTVLDYKEARARLAEIEGAPPSPRGSSR